MKNNDFSRRNFLKNSAIASGIAVFSPNVTLSKQAANINKLPREVWIASISQMDINAQSPQLMMDKAIQIVEDVAVFQPDIICFPEVFMISNIVDNVSLKESLELSEKAIARFSTLAKHYQCYLVCPVNTSENGKIYNSAVVIDRNGSRLGEYRKIHLTEGEIEEGLTPGPLIPPVFQTDFGKIGVQICFDMLWDDGWSQLKDQGAEIIFWPSAYAGGMTVNTKAWQHRYVVVSSTRKNTSKMCDISGEVIAQTGIWDKNFFCAPVNLEKAFLHTWPYVSHFDEIRMRYGRKIKITTFHEEEWSIIESLSPDVFVADVLKEFGLKTIEQHIRDAEIAQIKYR